MEAIARSFRTMTIAFKDGTARSIFGQTLFAFHTLRLMTIGKARRQDQSPCGAPCSPGQRECRPILIALRRGIGLVSSGLAPPNPQAGGADWPDGPKLFLGDLKLTTHAWPFRKDTYD